ncbi:MAG: leucine-rich repeat protein [Lentisphaeria bacterium]|nr:leucine-rich repeat protein [Lentisphaeria bacterium]
MGVGATPCFELEVSPTASSLTYGFTPYWNTDGYCRVLDWGDGTSETAVTSGTALTHTYPSAGTYTIKIKADCYRVVFGYSDIYAPLVSYCGGKNWNALGALNSGNNMFRGCLNMTDDINELPESIVSGDFMFYNCQKATLSLNRLPTTVSSAAYMFGGCSGATLPLSRLPENLSTVTYMFDGCSNAYLPLTSLPDGITNGKAMFQNCSKAELTIGSLPSGLQDGSAMFYMCEKANILLTVLPENIRYGNQMFRKCSKAMLKISKLPDNIETAQSMFRECDLAEINVSTLAENAPANGWESLTDIGTMFYNSPKVTGSRAAFFAKCPNATDNYTFDGTSTTDDVVSSATITFDGIYNSSGNKVDFVTLKYGISATYTLRATASNGATCTIAIDDMDYVAPPGITINGGTISGEMGISYDGIAECTFNISADGCEDLSVTIVIEYQSCVHPESLVMMADGTEKAIKDIEVGESVMSINQETGKFEPDIVLKNEYAEQCIYPVQDKWTFSDGTELITLARHRVFNVERKAFVYMHNWHIGEHARKADGSTVALVSHEVINEPEIMCTIRLRNNTYVVNGLLTGTRKAKHTTPYEQEV